MNTLSPRDEIILALFTKHGHGDGEFLAWLESLPQESLDNFQHMEERP